MKVRVSVVIPAYNAEAYVAEAIESVTSQDQPGTEVIVIDDGSRDATRREVQRAAHAGVPVHYGYQGNAGASAARNNAISRAQGEFLKFLDADDFLVQGSLSRQVLVMDAHPRADLSFGQAFTVVGRQPAGLKRPLRGDTVKEIDSPTAFCWLLQGGRAVRISTVMARTEAVRKAGLFQTPAQPAEDWDLYLRIAASGNLLYLPEPLA